MYTYMITLYSCLNATFPKPQPTASEEHGSSGSCTFTSTRCPRGELFSWVGWCQTFKKAQKRVENAGEELEILRNLTPPSSYHWPRGKKGNELSDHDSGYTNHGFWKLTPEIYSKTKAIPSAGLWLTACDPLSETRKAGFQYTGYPNTVTCTCGLKLCEPQTDTPKNSCFTAPSR